MSTSLPSLLSTSIDLTNPYWSRETISTSIGGYQSTATITTDISDSYQNQDTIAMEIQFYNYLLLDAVSTDVLLINSAGDRLLID